jgi:RNA polymerase sigma-70 factor (ECF subfamily)
MNEILNSQSIRDFQQGDEKMFRQVFDHYSQALFLFVYKLTGSREEGEDISLRCFQSLFNRCQSFETESNIKAFLFISARNSSLNYLKAKERDKHRLKEFAERMKDDTFLEYEYSLTTTIVAAIDQAIESLPQECRRIFKMLYYEELSPAAVASLLQISINTVYTQQRRAVSTLRLKLADNAMGIIWLIHTIALLQFKIPHPASFIQG